MTTYQDDHPQPLMKHPTMTIGYYPGCSLKGTAKEYDRSLRAILGALGVELREIEDWNCCGASSAHAVSRLLATALPARNINLAAAQNYGEILAPCAACYNRLVAAKREIEQHAAVRQSVEYVLEEPFRPGVEIRNLIEFFERIGTETIAAAVRRPLQGLSAACYYGCLLVRPPEITRFDDAETPSSMERIVQATGAKTVEWRFKTECCGAAHSIARKDIVLDLSRQILDDARASGADLIVVACPMCHSNLDMRQASMRVRNGGRRSVPVVYLSELVGYALGFDARTLGLDLHFIDPAPALAKVQGKEVPA
ncbi:MAG: CoB--CoM heterodisulfide reductase iron-sulfur subunit B family protein [Bacteroidota bacterium]|nr:CoB--CoM heterodisulfide reductase iron-sulfur subunit B family protein [Bacteroidota bacterium]